MRAQRISTLLILFAFAALPALGQNVYVDYDSATPFSQYKTFQFRESLEDLRDTSPMAHADLVTTLKTYAKEGGLEEVVSDPDAYISYYAADRGSLRLVLSDLEYTYGEGFSLGEYWEGSVGTRIPDTFTFREGTLIIDVWDADEKRLVWRGMATAALSNKPEKNAKKVKKSVKKLIKTWEKMHGGYVRALRKYQTEGDQ